MQIIPAVQPTGIQSLLQSRRFVTGMIDAVLILAIYFVGKYFSVAIDDLKFVIITLQVPITSLIAAFTIDDTQQNSLTAQLQMHTNSLNTQADMQKAALVSQAQIASIQSNK